MNGKDVLDIYVFYGGIVTILNEKSDTEPLMECIFGVKLLTTKCPL